MNHLLVCREYPPAASPPGGIGTYVQQIAHLLARSGEKVHIIAQRWEGAPRKTSELCGGKLVIHRVALDEPLYSKHRTAAAEMDLLRRLADSDCPEQVFAWQVARLAESLVESEQIDVIEAPEWEAPLYFFQLHRAQGLGPRRQPPCLIHLHSPSALIFRHNEWESSLTDFAPLCRLEQYTVRAADALICPSRYLTAGAAELFGIAPEHVQVLPYPRGNTPQVVRKAVWARQSICYVGRLELRKGIVEWIDAAVAVAGTEPDVTFDFVGGDTCLRGDGTRSVQEFVNARIPQQLRSRFRFHGTKSRAEMLKILAGASAAVIPSRWENLPYSCIEAMSTGLPVLVSSQGGMAELVIDGINGWIASQATASELASALWRMLRTPAEQRAEMGRQAGRRVRQVCGNQQILERHLQLRRGLAECGVTRSRPIAGPVAAGTHGAGDSQRGEVLVKTGGERRYSVIAQAHRGSRSFTLQCFLAAPAPEKLKWLRRLVHQPRRTVQWVGWQFRIAAGRALTWRSSER